MVRLHPRRGLALSGVFSLAMLLATACSTSASAPSPSPLDRPPTYVYDGKCKPGVVDVDAATVDAALRDMTDDGATFTFDAAAPGMDALQPGAVVLIWGLALRKIVSVDMQGATAVVYTDPAAVVYTDPAALTDAIQDGTIKWDQSIDFTTGGSGGFVASGGGLIVDDAGMAAPRARMRPRSRRRDSRSASSPARRASAEQSQATTTSSPSSKPTPGASRSSPRSARRSAASSCRSPPRAS